MVADARDGLGLYKVFFKKKKKNNVKTRKLKIELCAITPFGMALNPMVTCYIKDKDQQKLKFVCIDIKGDFKLFRMD